MIAVVVQKGEKMASCEDLVNAVFAVNTTLGVIQLQQQIDAAVLEQIRDHLGDISLHLGERLPHRQLWKEAMAKIIETILTSGDVVAERIAQQVQADLGLTAIAPSDIPDVPPLDVTLDIDTPGTLGGS